MQISNNNWRDCGKIKSVKRDRSQAHKSLGSISKLDIWVPHVLTERNFLRRINDYDTLIRRQSTLLPATKSGLFTTM